MKFSVYEFGGTRSNKIGVMGSLSVFPPPSTLSCKTRGSPGRVKQGGPKKSFGTNNWHSLGKGEKVVTNKNPERFSSCWTMEKGEHFWQKVLQKYTDAKRQKKGGLERFSKKMNAKYFV